MIEAYKLSRDYDLETVYRSCCVMDAKALSMFEYVEMCKFYDAEHLPLDFELK
jgi:hypothetical protein